MVEGARLESVYAGNRIAGSNPVLSTKFRTRPFGRVLNLLQNWIRTCERAERVEGFDSKERAQKLPHSFEHVTQIYF